MMERGRGGRRGKEWIDLLKNSSDPFIKAGTSVIY